MDMPVNKKKENMITLEEFDTMTLKEFKTLSDDQLSHLRSSLLRRDHTNPHLSEQREKKFSKFDNYNLKVAARQIILLMCENLARRNMDIIRSIPHKRFKSPETYYRYINKRNNRHYDKGLELYAASKNPLQPKELSGEIEDLGVREAGVTRNSYILSFASERSDGTIYPDPANPSNEEIGYIISKCQSEKGIIVELHTPVSRDFPFGPDLTPSQREELHNFEDRPFKLALKVHEKTIAEFSYSKFAHIWSGKQGEISQIDEFLPQTEKDILTRVAIPMENEIREANNAIIKEKLKLIAEQEIRDKDYEAVERAKQTERVETASRIANDAMSGLSQ
jgi:hypothetical protein